MDNHKMNTDSILAGIVKWFGVAVAVAAGWWLSLPFVWQVLLIAMLADLVTGSVVAIHNKTLSSRAAFMGFTRKVVTVILILVASYAIQALISHPNDDAVTTAIIAFYVYTEVISIIENAALLGVPVPKFLRDTLSKLNPDKFPEGQNPGPLPPDMRSSMGPFKKSR